MKREETDYNELTQEFVSNLRSDAFPSYLRVERDGVLTGVYTVVGIILQYGTEDGDRRSGFNAWECLEADTETDAVDFELVESDKAGPFAPPTIDEYRERREGRGS